MTLSPELGMCLSWAFSMSLETVTDDSSSLLSTCQTKLSAVKVRGVFRVSCMTVLCLPPLPELVSLASKWGHERWVPEEHTSYQ